MDRLGEMQAFVAVVEQGGFTGAADRLTLSKSAISKQVSALEARLGARLLNRTTRRVSATEIGLLYYERALAVLEAAHDADALATAHQDHPRGLLKVSAPVSFGTRHLSPLIARFLCDQPEVSIDLTLDDRRVDLIEGGYDLAIRIGQLEDSALMARKLATSRLSFVASPSYLAREGTPQRLEDLSRHQVLYYTFATSGQLRKVRGHSGEERMLRTGGRVSANNGDILLDAAKAGLGIILTPNFFIGEALKTGDLVEILDDRPPVEAEIHAVYPPGRYLQPKTRVFIDYLVEHFRGVDGYFRTLCPDAAAGADAAS